MKGINTTLKLYTHKRQINNGELHASGRSEYIGMAFPDTVGIAALLCDQGLQKVRLISMFMLNKFQAL